MKRILLFFFFCTTYAQAKLLIITHSYNRPDFIEIQYLTFAHFLQDNYEFIVFNDASDELMAHEIIQMCNKYNLLCIRIPQLIHRLPYLPREKDDPLDRPNIRHANAIQFSMDILGFSHNGPVMVLDSDMFLVRPLSVEQELKGLDILSAMRGADNGVSYLWPGLMIFSMNHLPNKNTMNFNCGIANNAIVDSGGHTFYYLHNNPKLIIQPINELFGYQLFCPDRFAPPHMIDTTTPLDEQIKKLHALGFNEKEIHFLQKKPHTIHFLFNHHFLHYRAGTNYDNQSIEFDRKKMLLIKEYLADIMA